MEKSKITKNRTLKDEIYKEDLFSHTSTPWQQEVLNKFLLKLKFPINSTCLDAACGIGNNIITLSYFFSKIVAFDKSKKAIIFAKKRYKNKFNSNLKFDVMNLSTINYKDNLFDLVVCTEALEHVLDYENVIKEIFRITKKNGYVILSFQNHFNLSSLIKLSFEKIFKKNWDVWGTHRNEDSYENYLTCFDVKNYISKTESSVLEEVGADYLNAWFSWIPFVYKNYKILDRYPIFFLGKLPLLKYFGMNYFMLIKKL